MRSTDRGRRRRARPLLGAVTLAAVVLGLTPWLAGASVQATGPPTITLTRLRGIVGFRLRGQTRFTALPRRRQVPVGTEVDVAAAVVLLQASSGQEGEFYNGRFVISLPAVQPPTVELDLSGGSFKQC